jgi:hypothetical protein
MNEKVSDEMLMAFVDGEVDAATADDIRRSIAGDPVLAERAAKFEMARDAVRTAYAGIRAQPVPEALVASILGHRSASAPAFPRRRVFQAALPLAASIAILFGMSGYWYGQQAAPAADPFGNQAIAEALGATASGGRNTIRIGATEADFTTLATYRVDGGLCRTFEVSGADLQTTRGVGCNRGADWTVDLTVAQAGGDSYAPASDAGLGSIDAFLDALEAQGPLSAEEEQGL